MGYACVARIKWQREGTSGRTWTGMRARAVESRRQAQKESIAGRKNKLRCVGKSIVKENSEDETWACKCAKKALSYILLLKSPKKARGANGVVHLAGAAQNNARNLDASTSNRIRTEGKRRARPPRKRSRQRECIYRPDPQPGLTIYTKRGCILIDKICGESPLNPTI